MPKGSNHKPFFRVKWTQPEQKYVISDQIGVTHGELRLLKTVEDALSHFKSERERERERGDWTISTVQLTPSRL